MIIEEVSVRHAAPIAKHKKKYTKRYKKRHKKKHNCKQLIVYIIPYCILVFVFVFILIMRKSSNCSAASETQAQEEGENADELRRKSIVNTANKAQQSLERAADEEINARVTELENETVDDLTKAQKAILSISMIDQAIQYVRNADESLLKAKKHQIKINESLFKMQQLFDENFLGKFVSDTKNDYNQEVLAAQARLKAARANNVAVKASEYSKKQLEDCFFKTTEKSFSEEEFARTGTILSVISSTRGYVEKIADSSAQKYLKAEANAAIFRKHATDEAEKIHVIAQRDYFVPNEFQSVNILFHNTFAKKLSERHNEILEETIELNSEKKVDHKVAEIRRNRAVEESKTCDKIANKFEKEVEAAFLKVKELAILSIEDTAKANTKCILEEEPFKNAVDILERATSESGIVGRESIVKDKENILSTIKGKIIEVKTLIETYPDSTTTTTTTTTTATETPAVSVTQSPENIFEKCFVRLFPSITDQTPFSGDSNFFSPDTFDDSSSLKDLPILKTYATMIESYNQSTLTFIMEILLRYRTKRDETTATTTDYVNGLGQLVSDIRVFKENKVTTSKMTNLDIIERKAGVAITTITEIIDHLENAKTHAETSKTRMSNLENYLVGEDNSENTLGDAREKVKFAAMYTRDDLLLFQDIELKILNDAYEEYIQIYTVMNNSYELSKKEREGREASMLEEEKRLEQDQKKFNHIQKVSLLKEAQLNESIAQNANNIEKANKRYEKKSEANGRATR